MSRAPLCPRCRVTLVEPEQHVRALRRSDVRGLRPGRRADPLVHAHRLPLHPLGGARAARSGAGGRGERRGQRARHLARGPRASSSSRSSPPRATRGTGLGPGGHLGDRREPRRDDRGRERDGTGQPLHRAPAARRRAAAAETRGGAHEPTVRRAGDRRRAGRPRRRAPRARGARAARRDGGRRHIGLAHPALASCRLVLCDLMLPDRSGTEVLREMRRRRPQLPVVLITGYATRDQRAARTRGRRRRLPAPSRSRQAS